MAFQTREEWLMGAVEELRPFFNGTLPSKIRVTCGFPSGGNRGNVLGECVSSDRSSDGHWEISIHPKLDKPKDVFAVLIHELCHTLPGAFNHGRVFRGHAISMKLTAPGGSYKMTVPDDQDDIFNQTYGALIAGLEAYPHASLGLGAKPKQVTRLLKAVCPTCGYTIRLTHKWASRGLPTCGVDGDTFNIEE